MSRARRTLPATVASGSLENMKSNAFHSWKPPAAEQQSRTTAGSREAGWNILDGCVSEGHPLLALVKHSGLEAQRLAVIAFALRFVLLADYQHSYAAQGWRDSEDFPTRPTATASVPTSRRDWNTQPDTPKKHFTA